MSKEDKLLYNSQSAWEKITENEMQEVYKLADTYKDFLNLKTEREVVSFLEDKSKKFGFKNYEQATKDDRLLFFNLNNVAAALVVVNDPKTLSDGFLINASHIDSPRIDLKPNPLTELDNMAFFKTHYYGGIKKYQWVARPLALHGVINLKDKKITVTIGEDEADPVFTINDLLPHLAKDQMDKKASDVITGEQLSVLIGNIPYKFKAEKDSIKKNIMSILKNKYGILEEDFFSAELELVPQGKARDVGLDASFVGGYGQDDRICAFLAQEVLFNMIDTKSNKNWMAIFFDKEEIGSVGSNGAASNLLERLFTKVLNLYDKSSHIDVILALEHSKALSSDVNAGVDPAWKEAFDVQNGGVIGKGICLTKYTGSRGKSGSNDASSEFMAKVISAFNKDGVSFQVAELGKVDQGGGGTVAYDLSYFGMDVIDCGPAILSMHSPFEVSSKIDLYSGYQAYQSFYKNL